LIVIGWWLWLPWLAGCTHALPSYRIQGQVFGTAVEITIHGERAARAQALGAQVLAEFNRLHATYHAWQPSALTDLNDHIARGEPYAGDAEMVYLLKAATELAERSDHAFNPAIGHLIRLWGFQSERAEDHEPDPAQIRRWRDANPRLSDLRYDGTRITSANPAVMLDFGGWVKGYALDRAASILRRAEVKAALINVGGNILAIGQPGNRPWRVGIQDPRHAGAVARVALHDGEAIGTSGDYRRYFMHDAQRRPHIIDPASGWPVDRVASVSVIVSGGDAPGLRSDGYSKPLFIADPSRWREMATRLGLTEVLLIDVHGNVFATPAMQARMDAATAH
jgi:thiamine biosynthesis lipoprotein